MFGKSNIKSNPRHWQPFFCPVYALACPLGVYQPFDDRREKITPVIYLGVSTIHVRIVALVLIFSMEILSPQFHVVFDPHFTTINVRGVNLIPPRYWQAMCVFIKVNKSVFLHSEQYDPSTTFIYPSYQGYATSENPMEPE